jgi:hypothetical protein
MLRELSSEEVASLLQRIGIIFKRHGKEDIYEGRFRSRVRTVIVPRNKKNLMCDSFLGYTVTSPSRSSGGRPR